MREELETLIYESADGVAVITLNRPDRMNSIGGTMKEDLATAFFRLAKEDAGLRCAILTGAGDRAFCAGADIKERAELRRTGPEYFMAQKATHQLIRGVMEFERPLIAAINGVALGGGLELALTADIRYAVAHAKMGLPEVRLGAIPGAGGTQTLPRAVGASMAKELLFTAEHMTAEKALSIGLVSKVVASDVLSAAMETARKIAEMPPLAVAFAKRAVNAGLGGGIDAGFEFERYAAGMLTDSEDRREGFRAFVEKRKPVYVGR
ncbi:enoyl-CoA hydratase/isomerase family protein [Pseudoroseomonas ludipueritiae]|uniref:Enoyl-CoA hydratase/isomerase family protein n=1 Tax=Pseudoroseomonas ludipueritiae TaxID=198093 RepID=A0ABR7R5F6_9PROT|nr:enoyl-CoA hydratase-related protein [Pseudoroseomonas ludipueritiae]MBC9176992.1 enoyl-CoA hydratase/isomerase family protein [Pseudoroseomonas ludipueritiae]